MNQFVSKKPFPDISDCASTDGLREEMNHILYDKGHFVSTDGHIMVRLRFELEPDSGLPEQFAIHRLHYKKLCKGGTKKYPARLCYDGKYLLRMHRRQLTDVVPIITNLAYPKYEDVLNRSKEQPDTIISEIGFTPRVLMRAMKVAHSVLGYQHVRMKLLAHNRAVRITCDDNAGFEMIVMPATLEDQL